MIIVTYAADVELSEQFVYHGTHESMGRKWLGEGFVHVGTKRAALSRVDPLKWEPDDYEQSDELAAGKSRIYRARIMPGANVSPPISDAKANVITDEDAWQQHKGVMRTNPYDVYPYHNEYEDPGSTSYLVRGSALHHVRSVGSTVDLLRHEHDYPYEDLRKHLGL